MELAIHEVDQLKIVHLKSELSTRGLPTEGTKGELVERLKLALASAGPAAATPSLKRPREIIATSTTEIDGAAHGNDTDDDDSDVGPTLPVDFVAPPIEADDTGRDSSVVAQAPRRRRQRQLLHEASYLEALPSASMYERSYMHRAQVTTTIVTPCGSDFVVTGSADGVVKFWKKIPGEIEFAKSYRAHLGAVLCLAASPDGTRLASIGDDNALKFYDVANFDMTDWVMLPYSPATCGWIYPRGAPRPLLAVTDRHTSAIRIYDANEPNAAPMATLESVHAAPVLALAYHEHARCVVSADARGVIEYWAADPEAGIGEAPPSSAGVTFTLKSDTDLYDVAKARAFPQSISIAPGGGRLFAVTATDRRIRVYHWATGKLARAYDEGLAVYEDMQANGEYSFPTQS